jgi:hypothetical protein
MSMPASLERTIRLNSQKWMSGRSRIAGEIGVRQSDAQPELNECFGMFMRSGIASPWIIGHSESMSLFTESHMDDLCDLLCLSRRQFLSDRFG